MLVSATEKIGLGMGDVICIGTYHLDPTTFFLHVLMSPFLGKYFFEWFLVLKYCPSSHIVLMVV